MKGPSDHMLDPGTSVPEKASRPKIDKPPGGKVLARLIQFAEERGLPVLETGQTAAPPAKAAGKTKAAGRKSARAAAPPESGTSSIVENYAASFHGAAVELQQFSAMAGAGAIAAA